MSPPSDPPQTVKALDRAFVGTLAAAFAAVLFLYFIRVILAPFVAAGVLAFVFGPVAEWIARRLRTRRLVGAIIVFLLLMGLAIGFAAVAGPTIAAQLANVAANLPALIANAAQRVLGGRSVQLMGQPINAQGVASVVMQGLRELAQGSRLMMLTTTLAAGLFAVLLTWVLLFYFLVDGPRIRSGLVALLPPPHRAWTERLWTKLAPALRRYFIGIGVVVVYACIASYIGLGLALNLHHAVLLALLTGLLEMIPVAGPLSSAVIAGIAAVEHATGLGGIIAYIIYAILLRLSIDQLIGPLVLGRAARIHPTVVIFAFLSGGLLLGISGVVLAVPIALSVKMALSQAYERRP